MAKILLQRERRLEVSEFIIVLKNLVRISSTDQLFIS